MVNRCRTMLIGSIHEALILRGCVEQMVIQNVFLAVRSHVHCLFGFSAYIGTNDHICNLATP